MINYLARLVCQVTLAVGNHIVFGCMASHLQDQTENVVSLSCGPVHFALTVCAKSKRHEIAQVKVKTFSTKLKLHSAGTNIIIVTRCD